MSGSVDTVRPSARFVRALVVIAVFGFVLRIAYIEIATGAVGGDGRYYHSIASLLADGKGFIAPKPYLLQHLVVPSAPHPPAWPLFLAGFALVGLRTAFEQQVIACLVGTATVVTVGFAGRRIAGGRVGIIAAAVAAVYPNFWLYERELMSETLTLFAAALLILIAYRFRDRATRGRALALGFSCGFIAIVHAEQLLLVGILLLPVILLARETPIRRRFAWAAMALAAAAVVILPWAAYNSARFHAPVLLGDEFGVTAAISNCPPVYSGRLIGFQDVSCNAAAVQAGKITAHDDVKRDNQYLQVGLDYARGHLSRVPVVVLAREARVWSLMPSQLRLDTGRNTSLRIIELGFAFYWVLVPLAVTGAVLLRRRRIMELPLMAFFVTVTMGVALTYGFTRFRAAAEVAIVLLAAVTIDAVVRWLTS
jgi:4-amino-4-deoxy-L-arabinose transferase-like glycosyltransferase